MGTSSTKKYWRGENLETVRPARSTDVTGMSVVLSEILLSWKSSRPSDPDHVIAQYIEHPDRIQCSVAIDEDNRVLGFQSIKFATDGNPYDLPIGWGIIGTYVRLDAGGRGIGKALFAISLKAAKNAGLTYIDATIGENNSPGLRYYDAMGFRTYRTKPGAICKRFKVQT